MYRFNIRFFHPLTAVNGNSCCTVLAPSARAALDEFEQDNPGDVVVGIDLSDSDRALLVEVQKRQAK